MKKIPLLILTLILIASCNSKQTSSELEKLTEKLIEKENQIKELQEQIENLEKDKKSIKNTQTADYYRFVKTYKSEINVTQKLKSGERKLIDKKEFKDTLDLSDNFFVYKHTSEITQTSNSKFESVLRDFDQVKSEYGKDFFVRVMTFYNGKSLPLETENSNTDIHILIRPTELGYKNKTFVISDFYNVAIKSLERNENSVELIFEHGMFPRKKELIIIKPELVRFKDVNKNFNDFIHLFNTDSLFQLSRVRFPIPIQYADWKKDYEYTKDTIEKNDYRIMTFEYDESYKTRDFDKYEQTVEINGNKATIDLKGIDNGINGAYYFEEINNKWILVSWVDSST